MPDLSPAEVRETVALVAMKFRAEMDAGDWPDDKCREMLAYISEKHSGDCTEQPWTCGRCEAEAAYKQADMLLTQHGLAALIQSQAKRIEELEGEKITEERVAAAFGAWCGDEGIGLYPDDVPCDERGEAKPHEYGQFLAAGLFKYLEEV